MIVIRLLPTGSCLVCDAVIYMQSYFEKNLLIVVAFYILKLTTLPAQQVGLGFGHFHFSEREKLQCPQQAKAHTKRADALASALLYIILLHLQNNSFAHLINHFPTAVSIYTIVHKVNACMHFYTFCVKNIDKSTFLSNLSFSK